MLRWTRIFCFIIIISLVLLFASRLILNGTAERSSFMKGRVLTTEGTPFIAGEESWVDLCLKATVSGFTDDLWIRVTSDGSYNFEGNLISGDYLIFIYAGGFNNQYTGGLPIKVHLEAGQTLIQDLTLAKPAITGKILTPNGMVFVRDKTTMVRIHLKTTAEDEKAVPEIDILINDDSSFRLGGNLPAGNYLLWASVHGDRNLYTDSLLKTVSLETGKVLMQDLLLTNPTIKGAVLTPGRALFLPTPEFWVEIALKSGAKDEKEITRVQLSSDGSYRLGGNIAPGRYKLYGYTKGNHRIYHDTSPVEIMVKPGAVLSQNLTLTNFLVRGRVLNPEGALMIINRECRGEIVLKGASEEGKEFVDPRINSDGTYGMGDLPPGDYLIRARTKGVGNPYTDSEPVSIHIEAGTTVIMDLRLASPALKGKVYTPDGAPFIPGQESWVDLFLTTGSDRKIVANTKVNSDGSFIFGGGIPTGKYQLYAHTGGKDNIYTDAIPVNLNLTAGILLIQDLKITYPRIKGNVLKPDGTPFQVEPDRGVTIKMKPVDSQELITETVNREGVFRIGSSFPAGHYLIWAGVQGVKNPYTDSISQAIEVKNDTTIVLNLRLTDPLISGKVIDPGGEVFKPGDQPGLKVFVVDFARGKERIAETNVNSDGTFRLGGSLPEGNFQLGVEVGPELECPYTGSQPVAVRVLPGHGIAQDLQLTKPLVTGKVFAPGGAAVIMEEESLVEVSLCLPASVYLDRDEVIRVKVNKAGGYKIGGAIPDGEYVLRVLTRGNNNPFADALPVSINLKAGQTLIQDFELFNPVITGRVLTPEGVSFIPPPDLEVYLAIRGLFADGEGKDFAWAQIRSNGTFRLGGIILTGTYKLSVYIKSPLVPYCDAVPVIVRITKGKVINQDLRLTKPLVTGRVFTPGGRTFIPDRENRINICLWADDNHQLLAEKRIFRDGSFKLGEDLNPGAYFLEAKVEGGSYLFSDSIPIPVLLSKEATLIRDLSLTAPAVAGKVLTPDGKRFIPGEGSDVEVFLRSAEGTDLSRTKVNREGFFRLGGNMPAGDYTLFAAAIGPHNFNANSVPLKIHLKADQTLDQDIILTQPLVTGRILTPGGEPYLPIPYGETGYFVYLTPLDNGKICAGWADDNKNGTYRIGGEIPAGDYKLHVLARGSNNPYSDAIPVIVYLKEGKTVTRDLSLTKPVLIGSVFTSEGLVLKPGPNSWSCLALSPSSAPAPADWEEIHNVEYRLRHFQECNWFDRTGYTSVNNDGTFRLGGAIPAGNYKLYLFAGGDRNRFAKAVPFNLRVYEAPATITRNIQLVNSNRPPALEAIGDRIVSAGKLMKFTIFAKDPDGDSLLFRAHNLPPGAGFDPETGTFEWTPGLTQTGKYAGIRFEATDGQLTDGVEITILVVE